MAMFMIFAGLKPKPQHFGTCNMILLSFLQCAFRQWYV